MAPISRTRLWAVARKELVQLRRDPRSLILAFLLPVFLLVMFGYAITWDVRDIAMVVVDQDHTAKSRELVDAFAASGYFRLIGHLASAEDDAAALRPQPGADRARDPARLRARPRARAGRAAPGSGRRRRCEHRDHRAGLRARHRAVLGAARHSQGRGVPAAADRRSRVWYNEELVSRNMIVPGLVATIMMIISAMLTALTIAREWERGTMEQLAATPVTRVEVVLGKLLPYLGIGLADVTLTSVLGVLIFGVPFRGSVPLLALLSFLFLVGALGLGIFISAAAKSQLLATQMALFATYLPAFLLSGFMFALEVMPPPLRALSLLVPARYFLVVIRGIFLKGIGLDILWSQALLMVAFAVLGMTLAVHAFRKELE